MAWCLSGQFFSEQMSKEGILENVGTLEGVEVLVAGKRAKVVWFAVWPGC